MRTTAKQIVDYCPRCGNCLIVDHLAEDEDGVWQDIRKCLHCKYVSGVSAGKVEQLAGPETTS